ncbi:MAG: hypothetical protein HY078_02015 [Elusimicrobia bacterium]|nr:hypothetical protein [Elusimicrobiota bacterium]
MLDPRHQLVILARLREFCQFQGAVLNYESDPWGYMRRKLEETEEAIVALKTDLLRNTGEKLLAEIEQTGLTAERCAEYKTAFEQLLSRLDFVDLAMHLEPTAFRKDQAERVGEVLLKAAPAHVFQEESKPASQRSKTWERLVGELFKRLDLDRLSTIMERKPRTARRRAYVLRRVRSNVAEYCAVVRIPTDPSDTFTPFMLPRIEALIAANLRFLNRYH